MIRKLGNPVGFLQTHTSSVLKIAYNPRKGKPLFIDFPMMLTIEMMRLAAKRWTGQEEPNLPELGQIE